MPYEIRAEITIGGEIKEKHLHKFLKALYDDHLIDGIYLNPHDFKYTYVSYGRSLCFSNHETSAGVFQKVEEFCLKYGLSYFRESDRCGEINAGYAWSTGSGTHHVHEVDCNDDPIISYREMNELLSAMSDISSLDDIPLNINTKNPILKRYCMYILEIGKVPDPIYYMTKVLEDMNPDKPKIPAFKIID